MGFKNEENKLLDQRVMAETTYKFHIDLVKQKEICSYFEKKTTLTDKKRVKIAATKIISTIFAYIELK